MTDQPTPTPRTDAVIQKAFGPNGDGEDYLAYVFMMQHARELERELRFNEKVSKQIWSANERLKRELDEAREQLAAERKDHAATADMLTTLRCELEAERALADRLAEALRDIEGRTSDATITLHPDADAKGCVDDCWEWSEEALATWKEARRE